jgi:hypothetical protein
MPIRTNLLAEALAAEEMRRRDPVKRVIAFAILLVAIMLGWAGYLQLDAMYHRTNLTALNAQLESRDKEYKQVQESRRKADEVNLKLADLTQLATNRFLYGNLLDGLQHVMIDDVQLLKLRVEQKYDYTEGIKPKTNDLGRLVPGQPAKATEKITLVLETKVTGANPPEQVARFKQAIASQPYFQQALGKTNEILSEGWSGTQTDPDGRPYVTLTLRCAFPEHTR